MVDCNTKLGSGITSLHTLMDKVKLLDSDGNVKNERDAAKEIAALENLQISDTNRQIYSARRRHKKRKSKNKKKTKKQITKRAAVGRNNNSCYMSSAGNSSKTYHFSTVLTDLNVGKFGEVLNDKRLKRVGDGFSQRLCTSGKEIASGTFKEIVPRSNKLKFADFYPEFDENETEDEKDRNDKDTIIDRTLQHLPTTSHVFLTCSFCGKRSVHMKTCTRCAKINYCDQTCQIKDYSKHRLQCKRELRFRKAYQKIPPDILKSKTELSLTFLPEHEFGRGQILLEIVEKTQSVYFAAMTTDLSGTNIFVAILLPPNTCYPKPNEKNSTTSLVSVHDCMTPGNFVIVSSPQMMYMFDGKLGVHVLHLEDVYFIFTDK